MTHTWISSSNAQTEVLSSSNWGITPLHTIPVGNADGVFNLGITYSTTIDRCPEDLIEAHKWFNIAAHYGHEDAANLRSDLADELTAQDIAIAQRRARQWLMEHRHHNA